jgi:putative FmdB family regulatory protein
MPVYEYKCVGCSDKVALFKDADYRDRDIPSCGACGSDIKRVYSSIGVSFRGSGFYSNDK